jgi:hypothetical protein
MASLEYINAAAALLLASVAALQAWRGGHPARWGAAAFAALAVALLIAALDAGGGEEWVGKALVCVLLAFPYLLLRFTVSLGAAPVRFLRPATAATVGIIPGRDGGAAPLPEEGAQPAWAVAYIVVVLAFWTVGRLFEPFDRLGAEARQAEGTGLGLALSRQLMQLMGGEVLHRLKADPETRTIPIVIVTADATPGQVRRMRELGADDYVTKPLDIARFGRVLDGIFETQETVS